MPWNGYLQGCCPSDIFVQGRKEHLKSLYFHLLKTLAINISCLWWLWWNNIPLTLLHLYSAQPAQCYGLDFAVLPPSTLPPEPLPLPRVTANCYWDIFLPGLQSSLTLAHSLLPSLVSREIWWISLQRKRESFPWARQGNFVIGFAISLAKDSCLQLPPLLRNPLPFPPLAPTDTRACRWVGDESVVSRPSPVCGLVP